MDTSVVRAIIIMDSPVATAPAIGAPVVKSRVTDLPVVDAPVFVQLCDTRGGMWRPIHLPE